MTIPVIKASVNGAEFIFDSSNHNLIYFDTYSPWLNANAYYTLTVAGTNYQVPSGKSLILLGYNNFYENTGNTAPLLYQTDSPNSSTGQVFKAVGDLTSISKNGIFSIFAANKYVTMKNNSGTGRSFYVTKMVGLEYTA